MAVCNLRSIIAALALMSAPCCSPHSDVPRRETSTDLPVPPSPARDIALPAIPKEEFVRLGFADYAGGTFGWRGRSSGTLVAGRGEVLEFVLPPDEIVFIPLRDIRAAEIGAKPGRDATRLVIVPGKSESHYLTLRYVDGRGGEQVLVLDLAANAIDGTLEFIEHGGIRVVHQ